LNKYIHDRQVETYGRNPFNGVSTTKELGSAICERATEVATAYIQFIGAIATATARQLK